MIKILTLTFLILGNFIGAGFASGKEIYVYFSRYGYISIFAIIVMFFLLNLLFKKSLYYGKLTNNSKLINKKIIIICSIITMAAMFSGSFSVGENYSKFFAYLFLILFIIIYFIVIIKGLKSIAIINFVLVPIMIIFILINVIFNFKFSDFNFNFLKLGNSLTHSIVYVSMNMFSLGCFLIEIAKDYSFKEIKIASLLSSLLISIIVLLVVICFNQNNITNDYVVPMQTLSKKFGNIFYVLFSIILLFSMFTTLISSGFVCKLSLFNGDNKLSSIFIPMLFALILSILGFNFIINYLYFVVGLFGFVFIFKLLINIKNEKMAKKTNFLKKIV